MIDGIGKSYGSVVCREMHFLKDNSYYDSGCIMYCVFIYFFRSFKIKFVSRSRDVVKYDLGTCIAQCRDYLPL